MKANRKFSFLAFANASENERSEWLLVGSELNHKSYRKSVKSKTNKISEK